MYVDHFRANRCGNLVFKQGEKCEGYLGNHVCTWRRMEYHERMLCDDCRKKTEGGNDTEKAPKRRRRTQDEIKTAREASRRGKEREREREQDERRQWIIDNNSQWVAKHPPQEADTAKLKRERRRRSQQSYNARKAITGERRGRERDLQASPSPGPGDRRRAKEPRKYQDIAAGPDSRPRSDRPHTYTETSRYNQPSSSHQPCSYARFSQRHPDPMSMSSLQRTLPDMYPPLNTTSNNPYLSPFQNPATSEPFRTDFELPSDPYSSGGEAAAWDPGGGGRLLRF